MCGCSCLNIKCAESKQKPGSKMMWFKCVPSYHGSAICSVQSSDWCCSRSASTWQVVLCTSEQPSWTFPYEFELQRRPKTRSQQWHWCPQSPLKSHISHKHTDWDHDSWWSNITNYSMTSKWQNDKRTLIIQAGAGSNWISVPSPNFVAMVTRVRPTTFCMVPLNRPSLKTPW